MINDLGPMSRSRLRSRRRWRAIATAAALSLLASVGTVIVMSGAVPTIAGAAAACTATQPGKVTYKTIATPTPTRPTALTVISSVTISDLSACNGRTAKLVFEGNTTGDPSGPRTTLSKVTSVRNPCTGAPLGAPIKVATGSVKFTLCPTPGTVGSDVHVHDLTFLTLSIAGVPVAVTTNIGSSSNNSGASTGSSSGTNDGGRTVPVATASSSSLAFTGADIALMAAGGLLAILLGLFLLVVGRRRRTQTTGGDTE